MSPVIDLAGTLPSWVLILVLVAIAAGAGLVGSLIGIGGGIFIVPTLVLVFGLDIHYAVAASLLAVVANSCASGSLYVEQGVTHLRVGMFLETATAVGALVGATLAVTLLASRGNVLNLAFVPVVVLAAALMIWHHEVPPDPTVEEDPLARRLRLSGSYREPTTGQTVAFRVRRPLPGLGLAGLAGIGSGLLGVGGGIFNVPAMNAVMNLPMRVATATSTFKIGVTASAGALVYLFSGDTIVFVAAPIALGSVLGSLAGSRLQSRAPTRLLTFLFIGVLGIAATFMAARGLGYLA